MRPFAWLHLRTRLPEDWEMMLYSLDPAYGDLAFYSRAGKRANLNWERVRIPRHRRGGGWAWEWTWPEEEGEDIRVSTLDPWNGLRLEWRFPAGLKAEAGDVVNACRPQEKETRRLTLSGIRARTPTRFRPREVQVHPAHHMLSLESTDHSRLVYRRWGLPDLVLRGESLESFFTTLLKSLGFQVEETAEVRMLGHDAVRVGFTSKGLTPFRRLLFRREAGNGWIWLDPEARRLCTLEQLGGSREPFPEPEDCFDVEEA